MQLPHQTKGRHTIERCWRSAQSPGTAAHALTTRPTLAALGPPQRLRTSTQAPMHVCGGAPSGLVHLTVRHACSRVRCLVLMSAQIAPDRTARMLTVAQWESTHSARAHTAPAQAWQ